MSQAKRQNEHDFHLLGFVFFPRVAMFTEDMTYTILISHYPLFSM